jgi:hypothetical protein
MKTLRWVVLLLTALALLVAVAAYSTRERWPQLAANLAEEQLADAGVRSVQLGDLAYANGRIEVRALAVSGEIGGDSGGDSGGIEFQLQVPTLTASFDWRHLLRGRLQTVTVGSLSISATQRTTGTDTTAAVSPLSIAALLPLRLADNLPLEQLSVESLDLSWSDGGEPVFATGNLQVTDRVQLQLSARQSSAALKLSATASADQPLLLEATLTESGALIASITGQLEDDTLQSWRWQIDGGVNTRFLLRWLGKSSPMIPEQLDLDAELKISGQIRHPDSVRPVTADWLAADAGIRVGIDLLLDIESLGWAGLLPGGAGNAEAHLALDKGILQLEVQRMELGADLPAALLGLGQEQLDWLGLQSEVPLHWDSDNSLTARRNEAGDWQITLADGRLQVGGGVSSLGLTGISLQAAQAAGASWPRLEFQARLQALLREEALPSLDLNVTAGVTGRQAALRLALVDVGETAALNVQSSFDIDSGAGAVEGTLTSLDLPALSTTWLPLLRRFDLARDEIVLATGSLSLSSELSGQLYDSSLWQPQSQLRLTDIAGSFGDYRFAGLRADTAWVGLDQVRTLRPLAVELDSLFVGFELQETRAQISLPQTTPLVAPTLVIEQFTSRLFGGRVYLPDAREWDFSRASNSLSLRAENWQLAELVALQQGQEIQAGGILEGELPVTVSDGRVAIEKGFLRARAPGGLIRYQSDTAGAAVSASSPELALALDLLRDFRYQTLDTRVELDRAGNLLLGLSLSGSNPAQYDGRAIEFNINLEQNIDPLLQSLRLSGKLVDQLESRLQ